MRTYDFSPLWRSTVGFDRLFDLAEMAQRAGEDNYPPYNIERLAEDRYQISLAVAGFAPSDIAMTAEQNVVTIELVRQSPEAMKPRRIAIKGLPADNVQQLEARAA